MLLRTLRRINDIASAFEKNDLGEAGEPGHFYRPVWVLWNEGLHGVFGDRSLPFHLGNLLLYAIVTLEVWFLVRRLAGETRAWVAGFAFALYPRHGETVAWISGSTDLTATTLALGALLCATAPWRLSVRLTCTTALTALAALSKEAAYTLPLLAVLLLWAFPPRRKGSVLVPGAMALVVLAIAILRSAVVGGVAGYTAYPWTLRRMVGALGSYVLASVTPPDLQLLRHTAYLLLPALLLALVAARVWVLARRGEREPVRLFSIGVAWFLITLLPSLNLAVDVSNGNGERFLFLGSVGLALSFAALTDIAPGRLRIGAFAGAAVIALGLSLYSSLDWLEAERISNRVIASAAALGPRDGELIILSSPEAFRTAHIFPGPMDAALERAGRTDLEISYCAPLVVRKPNDGVVSFERVSAHEYRGTTTWAAPFDFPVSRSPSPLSPDCSFARGADGPPGLGLVAITRPLPSRNPVLLAFFDGYTLRPCC